ncbi:hypothetical protein B4113_2375 [Geobacillus sp. B4113_201601]|nr:hypothetical protein B4113_2375 [Geobacillus sp. B4113_201601]
MGPPHTERQAFDKEKVFPSGNPFSLVRAKKELPKREFLFL